VIDVLNEIVFIIQTTKFQRYHRRADYKPYSRSFFLYDLLRLQDSNTLVFNNYKLSLSSATIDTTGKADKMLYLPDLKGDTRPIMAIEFVEVKG